MSANTRASTERPSDRRFAIEALHIFVLFSFAIVQPLFDVLGRGPEFFVAHEAGTADIVLLVLAVCLGPPALAVGVAWLAGFGGRSAQQLVVSSFLGTLFAAILLQASKRLYELPSVVVVPMALVLGIVAALAYSRFAGVRTFATLLSPGLVVFPALLLFGSPVSGLVFPQRGGPALHSIDGDVPIVFLVFDQLALGALLDARGEIDADFYPNFAALADEAIWYRNASSVGNTTNIALPAILTGNYPAPNGALPIAADHPNNLFTLVGNSYRMEVFETITGMCPETLCPRTRAPLRYRLSAELSDLVVVYGHLLLPYDLAQRLPSVSQTWSGFGGGADRADQYRAWKKEQEAARWQNRWAQRRRGDRRLIVEEFLRSIDSTDDQPSLHFLHVLLPHEPWFYLPSGQQYTRTLAVPGLQLGEIWERWERSEETVAKNQQRYLWQVRYVDSLVGRVVDRLRSVGLYDRALLIVASDHGASFLAGDAWKHPTPRSYSNIMNVPLLIKLPGQDGGRINDRNVETIDILPTVADFLGAELPWEVDGISILGEDAEERDGKVMLGRRGQVLRRAAANLLDRTFFLVGQRIATLGSGDDPSSWFRFGPYPELVGMPLEGLPVGSSTEVELTFDVEKELADVDPSSDFVPALLGGQFWAHVEGLEVVPLAVAINGVIRATATSFDFPFRGRGEVWEALIDPSSLIAGFNRVDLFAISGAESEMVLNHAYRLYAGGEPHNLALPAAQFGAAVRQSGWGETVWLDGEPLRWTGHDAELAIPVDADAPPTTLELSIARRAAGAGRLRITAGSCVLYEGDVTETPWQREFAVDGCGFGDEAVIGLRVSGAAATAGFGVAGVFLRSMAAGS